MKAKIKPALIILAYIGFGNWLFGLEEDRPIKDLDPSAVTADPQASEKSAAAPGRPARLREKLLPGFGYDQRFRHEDWNNIQDQNSLTHDEKNWQIFRQRFWLDLPLGTPNIELYIRMLNQFAKTTTPSISLNLDDVIFDNLYLNFKKTFIQGVSIKIGRQDMMFGEGFIFMDGTGRSRIHALEAGDAKRAPIFERCISSLYAGQSEGFWKGDMPGVDAANGCGLSIQPFDNRRVPI